MNSRKRKRQDIEKDFKIHTHQPCLFDLLPDEILHHIFSFVDIRHPWTFVNLNLTWRYYHSVLLTCRRFNQQGKICFDPSVDRNFPLHESCIFGCIHSVRALLQDPRVDPTDNNSSSIQVASLNGHTEVVQLLLDDGRADPTTEDSKSLYNAAISNHPDVVRLLLKDGRADPGDIIRWASEKGYVRVVELLLKDGRADPGDIIRWASEKGHVRVVELLLKDDRVDPNVRNGAALQQASKAGRTEVVKILLKDGRVDPTEMNSFALGLAVNKEHISVVALLLEDGRSDPAPEKQWETMPVLSASLELALFGRHIPLLKLLMSHKRVGSYEVRYMANRYMPYPEFVNELVNEWEKEQWGGLCIWPHK